MGTDIKPHTSAESKENFDALREPAEISEKAFRAELKKLAKTKLHKGIIIDEAKMRAEFERISLGNKSAADQLMSTWRENPSALRKTGAQLMSTPKGEVYGFVTKDKRVFLDPNKMNANAPIHEFGHLWIDLAEKINRRIYNRLCVLAERSNIYAELRSNPQYSKLTNTQLRKEAAAFAIGNQGENLYTAEAARKWNQKMMDALREFWQWIAEHFGLNGNELNENMTFGELTEAIARDLRKGKIIK